MIVAALDSSGWLAIAAVVSAISGAASSWFAHRTFRDEAEEKCYERLKAARAEAEEMANQLHRRKMSEAGER